jgi:preprotein translocase subunit SecD
VSAVGHTFDQHLAVALDGRLVMVAAIAFRVYPDGITGAFAQSVQLSGDFTRATAATVSTLLRSGPLAVSLTPR